MSGRPSPGGPARRPNPSLPPLLPIRDYRGPTALHAWPSLGRPGRPCPRRLHAAHLPVRMDAFLRVLREPRARVGRHVCCSPRR